MQLKPQLRLLMDALLGMLAACQSPGERRYQGQAMSGSVLALYATATEAADVAQGRFGAHPVALAPRGDLSPATGCTMPTLGAAVPSRVSCMRTKAGTLGWLPGA